MNTDYVAGDSLAGRAVSAFPLSIGTSLAFESVFAPRQAYYDPDRKLPEHVDVVNYQSCWINLTTMIRNITGAVEKSVMQHAKPSAIADTLCDEISVIKSLFLNEGRGVCKPFFYYSTYRELGKIKIPGFGLRLPSTPTQQAYHAMQESVLKEMSKRTDEIRVFHDIITPPSRDSGLIVTHMPYDLLSQKRFSQLHLLESHTGVLKTKYVWNTKYNPMAGKSFAHLPFHRKLLLVFGDRHLIKPMPGKIRDEILACSVKRNWTPMTTEDKVKLDLDLDLRDPVFFQIMATL